MLVNSKVTESTADTKLHRVIKIKTLKNFKKILWLGNKASDKIQC